MGSERLDERASGHRVGITGFQGLKVGYIVGLSIHSADKPAHMLRLDFKPLLVNNTIPKCEERMKNGGPEKNGEVVKQLQGRTCYGTLENAVTIICTDAGNMVILADITTRSEPDQYRNFKANTDIN